MTQSREHRRPANAESPAPTGSGWGRSVGARQVAIVLMAAAAFASESAQAMDVAGPEGDSASLRSLLEDLDAADYDRRERAEARLGRLSGGDAEAVLEFRPLTAEAAVRLRRVRRTLSRRVLSALSEAADGGDASAARRVPGLKRFSDLSDADACRVGAAVARRLSTAAGPLATSPQMFDAVRRMPVPAGERLDHFFAMAVLGSHPEVLLSSSDAMSFAYAANWSAVRRASIRAVTSSAVARVAGSFAANLPAVERGTVLVSAATLRADGLEQMCVEVLEARPEASIAADALAILSKFRSVAALPVIETYMTDRRSIHRTYSAADSDVTVADVAIVAAVRTLRQDPALFGYAGVRSDRRMGFLTSSAIVKGGPGVGRSRRVAADRVQARRRYEAFVKRQLPEVQPPPKRAAAGFRL